MSDVGEGALEGGCFDSVEEGGFTWGAEGALPEEAKGCFGRGYGEGIVGGGLMGGGYGVRWDDEGIWWKGGGDGP